MLWVGGSIVVHGLAGIGLAGLEHLIHDVSVRLAGALPAANGFAEWIVKATLDGIVGLAVGFVLFPVTAHVLVPVAGLLGTRTAEH
jgi:predicted DNA repair protein MutK